MRWKRIKGYVPYNLRELWGFKLSWSRSRIRNRSRAKVTAPAPAKYPGSGRLRLWNPAVCTLYSTVLVHCSYEFVFKVLQCMFWMWLMVVIVPHRILCMLYKVYIYNLLISLQYPEIFMFHMIQTILKLARYLRRWIKAECCLSHLYHTFFITIFQLPKNNWGQKSIDEQEMTQRCTGAHPNSNESKLRRCRGQC